MSDGIIPAERAEFFWNSEIGKAPHEFEVTDLRKRMKQIEQTGRDQMAKYGCSMGAHVADRLTGDGPQDTPEGIFATERLDKGADPQAIRHALQEIGKIDRCEWARVMLRALEYDERRRG